jgi:prevent-host-death family protein
MTISIAQSRQHLSTLIAAAQQQPQVISKRNKPVAVLVSAEYFERTQVAASSTTLSFYDQLVHLREAFAPDDDSGLPESPLRQGTWQRANAFTDPA